MRKLILIMMVLVLAACSMGSQTEIGAQQGKMAGCGHFTLPLQPVRRLLLCVQPGYAAGESKCRMARWCPWNIKVETEIDAANRELFEKYADHRPHFLGTRD